MAQTGRMASAVPGVPGEKMTAADKRKTQCKFEFKHTSQPGGKGDSKGSKGKKGDGKTGKPKGPGKPKGAPAEQQAPTAPAVPATPDKPKPPCFANSRGKCKGGCGF